MTSPSQIAANQINAQSSTGPRTPQGLAISSKNAGKHGLSSEFTLLSHESNEEFQELLATMFVDFEPSNNHEEFLVTSMAQARWREARCRRFESAAFELMLDPDAATRAGATPDFRIVAKMMQGRADVLTLIERYCTAALNQYTKCYRTLLQGRRANSNQERRALDNYLRKVVLAPLSPKPVPPGNNGFVSQNSQKTPNAAPVQNPIKAADLGNLALRL